MAPAKQQPRACAHQTKNAIFEFQGSISLWPSCSLLSRSAGASGIKKCFLFGQLKRFFPRVRVAGVHAQRQFPFFHSLSTFFQQKISVL
jgi:hypothetical protein